MAMFLFLKANMGNETKEELFRMLSYTVEIIRYIVSAILFYITIYCVFKL